MRLALPLGLLSLVFCTAADGDPPDSVFVAEPEVTAEPAPPPTVAIDADRRRLHYTPSDAAAGHLRHKRWPDAAAELAAVDPNTLTAVERPAWAFALSWALIRADKAAEAEKYLALFAESDAIPVGYAELVRGEVALAKGDALGALAHLEKIPEGAVIAPRARVVRAETLREAERSAEAWAIYEALIERPDPAPGNPEALLALANRHGAGSPEAYTHARRVWANYPKTEHSIAAAKILGDYEGAEHRATWQEVATRAEILMDKRDYAGAVREIERVVAKAEGDGNDYCRLRYTYGRSQYRQNRLSLSIAAFDDAGDRCHNASVDYGAKALYLQGMAEYRKSNWTASSAAFAKIPDLYPDSTFADDGLTQAGIALQEGEDLPGAQAMWKRALEEFPQGDTAPEATWRLAWSLYLEGRTPEAREIADRLGALDLHGDHTHVEAGRYWHARWALYPDHANPTVAAEDLSAKEEAVAGWVKLCEELPQSFYAILAHSRLREVAPEQAAELSKRSADHNDGTVMVPWQVRPEWEAEPHVQTGMQLAQLGLINEAMAEWDAAATEEVTPEEMAWMIEMRIASGDWLTAHDDFGRWLRKHPVGTLGEREPQIVRVAYPDRYWTEVQTAAKDDRYDPRFLHALSREESNFNRQVVSHAGAIGLSQLMPATADQVAGWLGMKVGRSDLMKPETNLKIGARYLDSLHKQHNDSPFLSLAAYNAGAGRVSRWIDRFGNVPTDEYVEHIPFRETRGYVKRVMGTWQVYRWQFDEGDAFYDLSAFNHQALPEET